MRKLTIMMLFLVSMAQAQTNIIKVEYWFDNDPGFDSATPASGFISQPDVQFNYIIPANLTLGIHTFGFRSKDADNKWSHTNVYPINITDSSHGAIVQVEYFWDTDPGFGSGTDSILTLPLVDIINGLFIDSVPVSFLLNSNHILYERSKDSRDRWSHTNYVDSMAVTGTVNVNELNEQFGINIFPNPFTDEITVTPRENQKMRLVLYSESGQLVLDKVILQSTQINMTTMAPGAYTVFVWAEKQKIYRSIIIKQ